MAGGLTLSGAVAGPPCDGGVRQVAPRASRDSARKHFQEAHGRIGFHLAFTHDQRALPGSARPPWRPCSRPAASWAREPGSHAQVPLFTTNEERLALSSGTALSRALNENPGERFPRDL